MKFWRKATKFRGNFGASTHLDPHELLQRRVPCQRRSLRDILCQQVVDAKSSVQVGADFAENDSGLILLQPAQFPCYLRACAWSFFANPLEIVDKRCDVGVFYARCEYSEHLRAVHCELHRRSNRIAKVFVGKFAQDVQQNLTGDCEKWTKRRRRLVSTNKQRDCCRNGLANFEIIF